MAKKLKDLSELTAEQLEEQQRQADLAGEQLPEVDESADRIDEILKSNDLDGGTVRLSRRGPSENSFSYVTKIKAAEFDIDFVKKVFGGGDYHGQTFRANGQMYKKFEFSIDARFQGTIELPKGGQISGQPQVDPVALMRQMHEMGKDDKGNSVIMQQMLKSQSEQSQQNIAMMQQNSKETMQMMIAMMTALATNRPAASDGLSVKDLIALLPTLVPLFKSDKPPSNLLETIEALKGMRELVTAGTVAEAPEAPKTLMEQILASLPHVATTVQALRGGQPTPQAPKPAVSAQPQLPVAGKPIPGAPPVVAASPAVGAPAAAGADDPKVQLLTTLVNAARKNKDVELYADLVNSELEDEDIPQFQQILTNEGWFDLLFGSLPDKAAVRPWFEQLRTLLLESFATPVTTPLANGSSEPVQPAAATPSGTDTTGVQSGRDADGASQN